MTVARQCLTLILLGGLLLPSAVAQRGSKLADREIANRGGGDLNAAVIGTTTFQPEPIRIGITSLPAPAPQESEQKNPQVIAVPDKASLRVPEGFAVNIYAADVPQARWLAITPDGDVLCSSGQTNQVFLFRDTDADGVADRRFLFLDEQRGANLPFGMDFAQVANQRSSEQRSADPNSDQWSFFLGNTDAVLRYPYRRGQTELSGEFTKIADLPGNGYNQHWTRNVRVAPDQQHLFVTVGSKTNVDPEPLPRATVLRMRLDGSQQGVFASGLRNPVGLDFHPHTGEVYVTVNERDQLGNDLVPDYLTKIEQGQFFGWPYAYLSPDLLDPRRLNGDQSERPDLVKQTHTPDVLFQAHSAALGLAFSEGTMFPERYRQGAFVAFRGSWNRNPAVGYKLVFVPFGSNHQPLGHYEDFVEGFLLDPETPQAWGRPVDVEMAPDGSLLFSEEKNGRIYRVSYRTAP